MEEPMLSMDEVCTIIGCTKATIYRYIKKGYITPYGKYLRKTMFLEEDVKLFKQKLIKKF